MIAADEDSGKDWWTGMSYKLAANVNVNQALAQATVVKQSGVQKKGAKDTTYIAVVNGGTYCTDDCWCHIHYW